MTTPPFAAYPLRPGVTFTHYGVAVDDQMRVMKNDGIPMQNVFAAGMVMAANVLGDGYLAGLAFRCRPCSDGSPASRPRGRRTGTVTST